MIRFELPSLGADMDEGTLLEWRVSPGERVARGQVVAVVDTSKAAVDVEIWQDGIVDELLVEPGQKIPVGTVMATLREPGDAEGPPVTRDVPAAVAEPDSSPPVRPVPSQAPPAESVIAAARHPVSPAARQRGRELEIDVEALQGTGAHGAVTIADVEHAARRASEAPVPDQVAAAQPPAAGERQAQMRRAIAAAMARAKREIPHYYLAEPVPMALALQWLSQRNAGLPISERILPAALLLKAVAVSLARTPELNGFWRNERFEAAGAVHVGVAISLRGGGLVAPAIHDVADKPVAQLMKDLSDLVRRARAGSLRSSELSDATITVTNLGDRGVESVAGIIYPPQVALVGFGRIAERAWAQDGGLRVMPVVTASLAADHRVSDGHRGAVFLAALRDCLQRPEELDAGA
jgi:pyruvate dehydrogenase E2 component (dihydrolipoamide acetyltransferase)